MTLIKALWYMWKTHQGSSSPPTSPKKGSASLARFRRHILNTALVLWYFSIMAYCMVLQFSGHFDPSTLVIHIEFLDRTTRG